MIPGTFMEFCHRALSVLEDHKERQLEEQRRRQAWEYFEKKVEEDSVKDILEDFEEPWSNLIEKLEQSENRRLSIFWSEDCKKEMDIKLLNNGKMHFKHTYDSGVYLDYVEDQIKISRVIDPTKAPERVDFWKNFQKLFKYLVFNNKLYVENNTVDMIEKTDYIATAPKFIFLIDEINRGEMSKIFGELFFSIDPGYRGVKGAVTTQYAALHDESKDKNDFYVPENVYILGTMNDIDRSVESFDFAMRRRFRFIEIKACDQLEMLDTLEYRDSAINKLEKLNKEIEKIDGLDSNYHIGPSYFLRLIEVENDFELLWTDYLDPLIREYIRGSYNEEELLKNLKSVYYEEHDERK